VRQYAPAIIIVALHEALEDKPPKPSRVWNRIPDKVREEIVQLALDEPELSPRELAARFIDAKGYFCLGRFGLPLAEGA